MNEFQRVGGIAALVMAGTFVIGFALLVTLLDGTGFGSEDPVAAVGFLADNQSVLSVWYLTIYVVFGIALVVTSLALHQRLRDRSPALSQIATAFGLIWAGLVLASGMIAVVGMGVVVDLYATNPDQAGSVWLAIESVQFGIGGGIEIVGALWVFLLSWTMFRLGELPRALSFLGLAVGAAGMITLVPALELFGAVFGLGLIVWFVWTGVTMVRSDPETVRLTDTA